MARLRFSNMISPRLRCSTIRRFTRIVECRRASLIVGCSARSAFNTLWLIFSGSPPPSRACWITSLASLNAVVLGYVGKVRFMQNDPDNSNPVSLSHDFDRFGVEHSSSTCSHVITHLPALLRTLNMEGYVEAPNCPLHIVLAAIDFAQLSIFNFEPRSPWTFLNEWRSVKHRRVSLHRYRGGTFRGTVPSFSE
jgi:hypothetical protein